MALSHCMFSRRDCFRNAFMTALITGNLRNAYLCQSYRQRWRSTFS
jgi:hypothetical protein